MLSRVATPTPPLRDTCFLRIIGVICDVLSWSFFQPDQPVFLVGPDWLQAPSKGRVQGAKPDHGQDGAAHLGAHGRGGGTVQEHAGQGPHRLPGT